jgi:hypothetical protein
MDTHEERKNGGYPKNLEKVMGTGGCNCQGRGEVERCGGMEKREDVGDVMKEYV